MEKVLGLIPDQLKALECRASQPCVHSKVAARLQRAKAACTSSAHANPHKDLNVANRTKEDLMQGVEFSRQRLWLKLTHIIFLKGYLAKCCHIASNHL